MYLLIVALLMYVLPIGSVVVAWAFWHHPLSGALVGKWFVFWSVGIRLLLAGGRQVAQPQYTARVVLSLKGDEALLVIRELGFANLALGMLGAASLVLPSWQQAGALAGGTFYSLAGMNHARQAHRSRLKNIAMVSDLSAGVVLLASFAAFIFASH